MTEDSIGARALRPLLVVQGVFHVALGGFMAVAPGTFYDGIGPFGPRNEHYVRDVSTFYLALGAVLLISVRRPSWRAPVLAFAAIEYALHALNHLVDVGEADPSWLGPADLTAVAVGGALLTWLLTVALRLNREGRR